MLELMGSGYLIDHCLSEFKAQEKAEIYRVYTAECLRLLTENTAKLLGGRYMQAVYSDLVAEDAAPKREEQTAEQIKQTILAHFGRKEESPDEPI